MVDGERTNTFPRYVLATFGEGVTLAWEGNSRLAIVAPSQYRALYQIESASLSAWVRVVREPG